MRVPTHDLGRRFLDITFKRFGLEPESIDVYYGPKAWRTKSLKEKLHCFRSDPIVTDFLRDLSHEPNFDRREWMERELASIFQEDFELGDNFSEFITNKLDIDIEPISAESIANGYATLAKLLPYGDGFDDRYHKWLRQPLGKPLLEVCNFIAQEHRNRAQEVLATSIECRSRILPNPRIHFGPYFEYEGGCAGTLNLPPTHLYPAARLPIMLAHELYPGHLLHFSKRESELVTKLRYVEHTAMAFLTPSALMAEALAENAFDLIYSKSEAIRWYSEIYYPYIDRRAKVEDDYCIYEATRAIYLAGAYTLLELHHKNTSESSTLRQLIQLGIPTEKAKRLVSDILIFPNQYLQHLLYPFGRRLVQKYLTGPNRSQRYLDLLCSLRTPSSIRKLQAT